MTAVSGSGDPAGSSPLIAEPTLPRRVRRPADLVRLVLVLAVLVVVVGVADVAVGTSTGLEQDLIGAGGELPSLVLRLLGWVAAIAELAIPAVVVVDLLIRSRLWQLLDALLAAGSAILVASALSVVVRDGHLGTVLAALTKTVPGGGRTPALDVVLASSVALLTVARIAGRRVLATASFVVLGSVSVTSFLSGDVTAMALFSSVMLGWALGLVVRYAMGAASTRPPGSEVAATLIGCGIAVQTLTLEPSTVRGVRRYAATTATGPVEVHVLDRDTFGSAAVRALIRRLRLRGPWTRAPALSLKAAVEHRVLMSLTLERLGIVAPRVVAAAEVGPFAATVAYETPAGPLLAALPDIQAEGGTDATAVSHGQLLSVYRLLATLQRAKVAHRGLKAATIMLLADDQVALADTGDGDIAAGEIPLRLDLTQLLTTVSLKVGPERAVAAAAEVLGAPALLRALPLLQAVALSRSTRVALRHHKRQLHQLRSEILALVPAGAPVEQVEPRRLTPRMLLTVVGGTIAAYVLLTQLAQVNLGQVLTTANWEWALGVLGFTALTVAGASFVLTGAVAVRLRFVRTYMTQLGVAFSGLLAPAAVGNIALNTRYLQRAGVDPAVAGASVGLAQLAQFCSYIVLLALSSVIAGSGPKASFTLPPVALVAVAVIVGVALVLLALPVGRRFLIGRFVPLVQQVVPRVISVFQQPRKVAALFGGALLLDLSFVGALTCATRAFGASPSVPTVAVVYFAGAIIGSAVPTPGGLGGVEAALSAGLVAAGVPATAAVSAVLLYRLATYWLPIPFGWISLNHLTKVQAI